MGDFKKKFKQFVSGGKEEPITETGTERVAEIEKNEETGEFETAQKPNPKKHLFDRVRRGEISPYYGLYIQLLDFMGTGLTIPLPQQIFEERLWRFISDDVKDNEEFQSFMELMRETAMQKLEILAKQEEIQGGLVVQRLFAGSFSGKRQEQETCFFVTKDQLTAYSFLFPPLHKKENIVKPDLWTDLANEKISYGVDKLLAHRVMNASCYFQFFVVARGESVREGQSGEVIEHFQRSQGAYDLAKSGDVKALEASMKKQQVKKGTVICEIVKAIPGRDGKNVYGEVQKAQEINMPEIPMGIHTILSPDKTKLLAEVDGFLAFDFGRFHVRNMMVIPWDLDSTMGEVYFDGDIEIAGNVKDDVVIDVKGSMLIHGDVYGAKLTAGDTMTLKKGVIGGHKAVLKAKKEIRGGRLEECQVYSNTDIYAECILNAQVYADGSIYVDGEEGIEESTIVVGYCVEADRIGKKGRGYVSVTVGTRQSVLDQKIRLEKKLQEEKSVLEHLQMDLKRVRNKELTQAQKYVLEELVKQEKIYIFDIRNAEIELETIIINCPENPDGYMKARIIYPDVDFKIGDKVYSIQNLYTQIVFRYLEEKSRIIYETWQ